jgi:hypothetical protein
LSIRDSRAPSSRFAGRRLPRKSKPAAAPSSSSSANVNGDPFVIYDAEEDEDDNDEDDNGDEIDSERMQLLGKMRAKPIGGHVAIDLLVDESAALPPAW